MMVAVPDWEGCVGGCVCVCALGGSSFELIVARSRGMSLLSGKELPQERRAIQLGGFTPGLCSQRRAGEVSIFS